MHGDHRECRRSTLPYFMIHQHHIAAILDQLDSLVTTSTMGNTPLLLSDQLRQELMMLVGTPAFAEVEQLLTCALQHPHRATRIIALDIVNQLGWQSDAIIRALLATWRDYASPSAALLMTLDTCWKRHPSCFPIDTLPMRQLLAQNPILLPMIIQHHEWQSLLRILYIPIDADVDATQINRDSPLTQLLVDAFSQSPHDGRANLITALLSYTNQWGSALARDAILALSVLGNTEWLAHPWLRNPHAHIHLQSFLALFVLMWSALIIHSLDINLDHAHDLAIIRAPHVATIILSPRDPDLERARIRLLHLVSAQVPLLDRRISAIYDLADTLQTVRDLDYDLERAQEIAYMVADLHLRYPHNLLMQRAHHTIQSMCATLETAITFSHIWDAICSLPLLSNTETLSQSTL